MRSIHKKKSIQVRSLQDEFAMEALPTNTRPYFRQRISLQLRRATNKKGRDGIQNCYPVFNNDGLHYTPSFLLDSDKDAFQFLDEMLKNQYIEKLKNSQEKSTKQITLDEQILTAHPNSKVCYVCKSSYTDYNKHIDEESHKANVNMSDYNYWIDMLCEQFVSSHPKIESLEKPGKEVLLLSLTDQAESSNRLPRIPILIPFDDFFEQSPPLKYR